MLVYECVCCFSRFRADDGEYRNGSLVCPSCGSEDLDTEEVPDNTLAEAEAKELATCFISESLRRYGTVNWEVPLLRKLMQIGNVTREGIQCNK